MAQVLMAGGAGLLAAHDVVTVAREGLFYSSKRGLHVQPRQACRAFAPARISRLGHSHSAAGMRPTHICAAISHESGSAHVQLATALLPKDVDVDAFCNRLYQWVATVTSSGMNMPLALPMRVSRLPDSCGFEMSFLRMRDSVPVSVADITATVEEVAGKGQVLFVRLYDAEGSDLAVGQHKDSASRVQALSQALVDVSTLMTSMPPAIKLAVVQSRN